MFVEHFFELLQVAIDNRTELTSRPTDEEWASLFVMAKQQQVAGVVYEAMLRLPEEQRPKDKGLLLKWHGLASKIERRNREMSELSEKALMNMRKAGFECLLMKGQSLLEYYPEHLRDYRSSGDIDLWVRKPGMRLTPDNEVYRFVRGYYPNVKSGYIHIDFPALKDTDLEVHIRPMYLANPWHNRQLQRWFVGLDINSLNSDPKWLLRFNKVFLLLHLYKHFIHEGATMRQLMDYYFVLRAGDSAIDEALLKRFGVWQFYQDVIPVIEHVFEAKTITTPRSLWLLNEVKEPIDRRDDLWKRKIAHAFTILKYYPDEVFWQPFFSLYSRLFWDRKR